mmetsp:Transcript_35604/g.82783  ORF Transcript_35604/g.82783 Transcript_35604/m.82783 type:complete len:244 (-) Transcript_35604:50-781(-)
MVETKIYLLDGHDCVRAAEAGKSHLIKRLLDNREPIDIADERKWTPLHYAASFAQENCVLHLLAKGANPSARTDKGWTPLHRAVHSGHSTVCNLLLEAGTDVNAENTAGETALHMAAAANNVPLVEQLLEHNADPSLRDMERRCAVISHSAPRLAATFGNTPKTETAFGRLSSTRWMSGRQAELLSALWPKTWDTVALAHSTVGWGARATWSTRLATYVVCVGALLPFTLPSGDHAVDNHTGG